MKRVYVAGFIVCLGFAGLIQACGSSSGSSTDDATSSVDSADTLGAATTAAFGGMGEGSLNQEAGLHRALDFFIRKALAQEAFTACDAVSSGEGPAGITMSLDGTDATYGASSDALVVASGGTFSFCADGGDVAAWAISASSAVSMTCTDSSDSSSATVTMSGSGVFREGTDDSNNDVTMVRGTFVLSVTGGNSVTATCSWDITHAGETDTGGDFNGGCEDENGAAITGISETFSCTDPS